MELVTNPNHYTNGRNESGYNQSKGTDLKMGTTKDLATTEALVPVI